MKNIKNMLLLTALLGSLPTYASDGAGGGNGGGGICYANGKCVTLAQAGFRVNDVDVERNSLLTYEVMDELSLVLKLLPPQLKLSLRGIVGEKGDVQEVEVTDQKRMKSFLKKYREVLAANGAEELSKNLELMAFTIKTPHQSHAGTTYLINGKFDSLSVRGRALILIHEFVLRKKEFTLTEALALDGAILDFIDAKERGEQPKMIKLIKASKKLFYYGEKYSNGFIFNEALIGKEPLPLVDNNLSVSKVMGTSDAYTTVSLDQLLQWRKTWPLMSQINDKENVPVNELYRQELILDFPHYIKNKLSQQNLKSITVSNELWNEYLHSKKLKAENFEVCGSIDDKKSWFVGTVSSENFENATAIFCESKNFVPAHWVMTRMNIDHSANIRGGSLNLTRTYECKRVEKPGVYSDLDCK